MIETDRYEDSACAFHGFEILLYNSVLFLKLASFLQHIPAKTSKHFFWKKETTFHAYLIRIIEKTDVAD